MRARLTLVVTIMLIAVLAADVGVLAASTVLRGGAITSVVSRNTHDGSATTSTTLVNVPDARVTMSVPAGQQAMFIVSFSATTRCTDDDDLVSAWCSIQVFVDGEAAHSFPIHLDSAAVTNADYAYASGAMTRAVGPYGPGSHTVSIRYKVDVANASFRVDAWSLVVQRARVQ